MADLEIPRTSLLLLQSQLLPVGLHAVPKRHPQIGLLLRGHVLPSFLDVGESWVGNGMGLANLLLLDADGGENSLTCCGRWDNGTRASRGSDNRGAQHRGG